MRCLPVSRDVTGSDKSLATRQSQQIGSCMCRRTGAELSVRAKYSFICLLLAASLELELSDGAKWAQNSPLYWRPAQGSVIR